MIIVVIFESRIDGQACSNPESMALTNDRPWCNSSLMRAKMRTLASTAMPMERMNPAIPASVSVTGMSLKMANTIAV